MLGGWSGRLGQVVIGAQNSAGIDPSCGLQRQSILVLDTNYFLVCFIAKSYRGVK